MNYIITENKLYNLVIKYLNNIPELSDLWKTPLYEEYWTGYYFLSRDMNENYRITYMISDTGTYNSNSDDDKSMFPMLKISEELYDELVGMFGIESLKYFTEWFTKKYKLPVTSFYYYQ